MIKVAKRGDMTGKRGGGGHEGAEKQAGKQAGSERGVCEWVIGHTVCVCACISLRCDRKTREGGGHKATAM